jgi:hypothetical protein
LQIGAEEQSPPTIGGNTVGLHSSESIYAKQLILYIIDIYDVFLNLTGLLILGSFS